jgi:hypothetical protein
LPAFVDRQCERLFAVDVFSCTAGIDHHLCVPVVGTANGDDVDILASEQIVVVFTGKRRTSKSSLCLIAHMAIHITDRCDVAIQLRFVGDDCPLIPQSDRAHSQSGHGHSRCRRRGRRCVETRADGRDGRSGQKMTAMKAS